MHKLENNYRRAQQLVEQQMISANDVDQIKYDLENARAVYRAASLELSYTTVTAPISGVVASRSIKSGNFVQINSPIIRIVDASRLEATLNVPEREIAKLKPGQAVGLTVDALPGKQFTGTVARIAPVVDNGSRYVPRRVPRSPAMANCSRACSAASASTTTSVPMPWWCRASRCWKTVRACRVRGP